MGLDVAAALASVFFKDMFMAIGAADPEIIVGHVKEKALVVRPAPGTWFASHGTAIFLPIAFRTARDGIKLLEIQFFGPFGAVLLDLFIGARRVDFGDDL